MPSPPLTPEILKCQGIIYNETVIDSHDLNHVNTIREGLLDFDGFLIRDVVRDVLLGSYYNYDEIPESAFRKSCHLDSLEREVLLEFVKTAQEISYRTKELEDGLRAEPSWQHMFRSTVFKPRKDLRSSKLFAEQISSVSDGTATWNEAHSIRDLNDAPSLPSIPKPDFYFGFPIYDVSLYCHHGFVKVDFFQNFTTKMLFHLKGKGLCPAPTSGFATGMKERVEKNKSRPIAQHDLLCFPWAVVELKKFEEGNNIGPTTTAYCQAANGGSTALCMLENLTKFSTAKQNNQHIPPVVTFTCVGGKSKVWLAYSHPNSDSKRDHRMVCIWEGSLSKIWDAIQFCRIKENVSSWARDILKQQISECIGQWRAKYPIPSTSSIVHQSKGQGVTLSLSYSSDSSGLVQSVTTLEEFAVTTQRATSIEKDIQADHSSSIYETIQESDSHQVISNKIVKNKPSLLSESLRETVDEHIFAEAAGLRSETRKSLPRFSQEAKKLDLSTTIFKGSRQKPFGPFINRTSAKFDFNALSPTLSNVSIGCHLGTKWFSPSPFVQYFVNDRTDTYRDAFQSISSWPSYRGYSPEELRLVDYNQSRRFGNHGSFDMATLLSASNTNIKSSSFVGATQRPLFGSTQPLETGFGANTTTSSILFGNQSQTSSLSGTLFGSISILAGDDVFGKQRKTNPTSGGNLGMKISAPPSRSFSTSRTGSEGLPGKQNETQPSSADTFTIFGKTAHTPRGLDHGKITRPDKTEPAFDFPLISQSKDLKFSVNEDFRGITSDWHVFSQKVFNTTQFNNVGPLIKDELTVLAKRISSFAKGTAVPSPQNGKFSPAGGSSEELTSLLSSELMNLNIWTTGSPECNSSAEELCGPSTKKDHGNLQREDEIQPTDEVFFGAYGQLSDMYGLRPERNLGRSSPGKSENKVALKLPSFVTGNGSLNITHLLFQETRFKKDNEEEKLSAENVDSNEEEEEDGDWEDIDSDEDEPELRGGYEVYQSMRRASLISQARKQSARLTKRKRSPVVKRRRVRTGFPSRNL